MGASSDPTALGPGNAGGAKDPDFWCAFEAGEVKVIGDEPLALHITQILCLLSCNDFFAQRPSLYPRP
jgi:hypothetical protein